jgi:hypothetical protein
MNRKINTEKFITGMIVEGPGRRTQICPHLGLKDDPSTALGFPSLGNHCYHARPVQPVRPGAQRLYCLSGSYPNCEEFNKPPDTPLQPGLRSRHASRQLNIFKRTNLFILLAVLAVVGLIAWQVLPRGLFGSKNSGLVPVNTVPALSATVAAPFIPIAPTPAQNTPTPTFTTVPSATPLPSDTFTPAIESPHALETPIGIQHKFIIHVVLDGESLPSLASHYWTTIEAIQAVNFYLPTPIQVGWLVIIPPDQTDVSGLPAFEPYQVKADVAVEKLAQQLSVDPGMLKLYNSLNEAEILHADDWLIIPHIGTAIP